MRRRTATSWRGSRSASRSWPVVWVADLRSARSASRKRSLRASSGMMCPTTAGSAASGAAQRAPHHVRLRRAELGDRLRHRIPLRPPRAQRPRLRAARRDLAQDGFAVADEPGAGHGHRRGRVHDVREVQAHHARAQAVLEGGDVAVVQPPRDRDRGQGEGGGQREEDTRVGRTQRGGQPEDQHAADDGAEPVEAHVDDGLGGPLAALGDGREEQLVAGSEERVVEDAVRAAGDERAPEAGRDEAGQRAHRDRRRPQGHRSGQAQAAQRGPGQGHLHGQPEPSDAGVEQREERHQGRAAPRTWPWPASSR